MVIVDVCMVVSGAILNLVHCLSANPPSDSTPDIAGVFLLELTTSVRFVRWQLSRQLPLQPVATSW